MKLLPLCITSLLAGAVALSTTGVSVADDGAMFRKNVSKTPELETEHGALRMLPLYVPAQASDGTLLTEGIEYDNADGALVDGGLEPQLRQAMANLRALLEGEGSSLDAVVKTTVFLVDMGDYAAMNEVYIELFGDHRPARSAVAVAALPIGAVVELEAWAWAPAD